MESNGKVVFTPNVPVQVALRYPEGKQVEGRFGDQMFYSLVNGQVMYLDMAVAAKINALGVGKGEPVTICKRWSGKKGDPLLWDVWLPAAGETAPSNAMSGIGESALEADVRRARELAARLAQPGAGADTPAPVAAAPNAEPPAFANNNGNGSRPAGPNGGNGHAKRAYPAPPTKIPMNEAVVEAVRMVRSAMEATGEQWSDQAKQGLVSTVLIAADKNGWLAVWKREVSQ